MLGVLLEYTGSSQLDGIGLWSLRNISSCELFSALTSSMVLATTPIPTIQYSHSFKHYYAHGTQISISTPPYKT